MTADKEAIMQYTIMINTSTDKHGYSHRKCVVTLPYEDVKNAGLVGREKTEQSRWIMTKQHRLLG